MRLFKLAGLAGLSAASPTKPDNSEVSAGSNTYSDSLRVDCYPENDADEAKVSTIKDPNKSNTQKYFRHSNVKRYELALLRSGYFIYFGRL